MLCDGVERGQSPSLAPARPHCRVQHRHRRACGLPVRHGPHAPSPAASSTWRGTLQYTVALTQLHPSDRRGRRRPGSTPLLCAAWLGPDPRCSSMAAPPRCAAGQPLPARATRGATGTDMNSLPLLAIDTVQVLRRRRRRSAWLGRHCWRHQRPAQRSAPAARRRGLWPDTRPVMARTTLASAYRRLVGRAARWHHRRMCKTQRAATAASADFAPRVGDGGRQEQGRCISMRVPARRRHRAYFVAGAGTVMPSSVAWARDGSSDIPRATPAAMCPDGFALHQCVMWLTATSSLASQAAWRTAGTDVSQTYGQQHALHHHFHTLNAHPIYLQGPAGWRQDVSATALMRAACLQARPPPTLTSAVALPRSCWQQYHFLRRRGAAERYSISGGRAGLWH